MALAPTYPECDEADLRATLKAVAELEPITIFHEPINIRAENVARIERHAESLGLFTLSSTEARAGVRSRIAVQPNKILRTEVFTTRESWQDYAVNALHTVSQLARELGIEKHLHLWPDKSYANHWPTGCRIRGNI